MKKRMSLNSPKEVATRIKFLFPIGLLMACLLLSTGWMDFITIEKTRVEAQSLVSAQISGLRRENELASALAEINRQRAEKGLQLVLVQNSLQSLARQRAAEMWLVPSGSQRPNGMTVSDSIQQSIQTSGQEVQGWLTEAPAAEILAAQWIQSYPGLLSDPEVSVGLSSFSGQGSNRRSYSLLVAGSVADSTPGMMGSEAAAETASIQVAEAQLGGLQIVEKTSPEEAQVYKRSFSAQLVGVENQILTVNPGTVTWIYTNPEVGVFESPGVLALRGVGTGQIQIASAEDPSHPYEGGTTDYPVSEEMAPPKPTEPTEPTEPTNPTEPTDPTPTDPSNPTEPTDPTSPTDPSEPTQPDTPTDPVPTEPTKPSEETEPTNPQEKPDQPTEKGDPLPSRFQTTVTGKLRYEWAEEVLNLINQARAQQGKSALTYDWTRQDTASSRAIEGLLWPGHQSPSGEIFKQEVLTKGKELTPQSLVNQWLADETTRSQLMSDSANRFSLGSFQSSDSGTVFYAGEFRQAPEGEPEGTPLSPETKDIEADLPVPQDVPIEVQVVKEEKGRRSLRAVIRGADGESFIPLAPSQIKWSVEDLEETDWSLDDQGVLTVKKAGSVTVTATLKDQPEQPSEGRAIRFETEEFETKPSSTTKPSGTTKPSETQKPSQTTKPSETKPSGKPSEKPSTTKPTKPTETKKSGNIIIEIDPNNNWLFPNRPNGIPYRPAPSGRPLIRPYPTRPPQVTKPTLKWVGRQTRQTLPSAFTSTWAPHTVPTRQSQNAAGGQLPQAQNSTPRTPQSGADQGASGGLRPGNSSSSSPSNQSQPSLSTGVVTAQTTYQMTALPTREIRSELNAEDRNTSDKLAVIAGILLLATAFLLVVYRILLKRGR